MALQLQIYVDLRPNSFHVYSQPLRGRRRRARTTRSQADDSLSMRRENGISADRRVSFTQGGHGIPSSSVAAPGYSSVLRRFRRQEMNVNPGDRFLQIAEWVYRKVKDPMVEIDPVTVEEKIKADEEQEAREEQVIEQDEGEPTESSEETIATVAPPTFVPPESAFSRVNFSTKVAGAALIVAALLLAYLGFRSKSALLSISKQNSGSSPTSPGPAGIGGKRNAGTSRVQHHSSNHKESSPPQGLHEQFRYSSDGDSSNKAVALRASVVLTSWQTQTIVTSTPAVSSHREKTSFHSSPSVTPTEPTTEETEKAVSRDVTRAVSSADRSDLPLARPFEEVVAVNEVGHDNSPIEDSDSEVDARPFEEVVALNGVGHDRNPAEVADSETEAKPFEEVVAVIGLGHDSSALKLADSEADEFHNVYEPHPAGNLWLKEDTRRSPAFGEEDTSATATSRLSEVDITTDTSSPHLPEDAVLLNLDADSAAQPVNDDGPVTEVLNGAATTTFNLQDQDEKRKSYDEAIQAVVPAIAIGAGAVSILSGVNSGLETVGLMATASFVAREMIMASAREQLFRELRKVKDRKSFVEFLRSRHIIRDLQQE